MAELEREAAAVGLALRLDAPHRLGGEVQRIRSRWWLGGRSLVYRMSCRLTEADHTVHFREAVLESSWGIPPPTLVIEASTLSGWKRSGERREVSFGGGGAVDYAELRDVIARACSAAGWTFRLEGGRLP
jgi:hypothetical protein